MRAHLKGEDRLVADLLRLLPTRPRVPLAAGDDCAAVAPAPDGWLVLLKTDALVEGIHFRGETSPGLVGRKALARAISDIAAMGGIPEYALVTVAACRDRAYLKSLYRGIAGMARQFHVRVVGGETARSPGPLFLSVALAGRVEKNRLVTRSGGRPGDALFVTGTLGGSLGGHHLRFVPRVKEARWLGANFRVRAMMDLSDGLAADLPRLARASGTGFCVDFTALPRRRGCSVEEALRDGEDYELLFAVPGRVAAGLQSAWQTAFPKTRLTRIGELTVGDGQDLGRGFDHFPEELP